MIAIPTIDPATLRDAGSRAVSLDVEQYHGMIRAGLLAEGAPIELLDGMLVCKDRSKRGEPPMSIGLDHTTGIENLEATRPALDAVGHWLRAQQPVTLPPRGEPEPDGAIVRGPRTRYRRHHPHAAEICVVIEVADSSLQHDRTTKLRIYAAAGIGQYVIVNLVDDVVEVYAVPDAAAGTYAEVTTAARDGTVTLRLFDGQALAVPAADLLP